MNGMLTVVFCHNERIDTGKLLEFTWILLVFLNVLVFVSVVGYHPGYYMIFSCHIF